MLRLKGLPTKTVRARFRESRKSRCAVPSPTPRRWRGGFRWPLGVKAFLYQMRTDLLTKWGRSLTKIKTLEKSVYGRVLTPSMRRPLEVKHRAAVMQSPFARNLLRHTSIRTLRGPHLRPGAHWGPNRQGAAI